jgi:cytochrome c5
MPAPLVYADKLLTSQRRFASVLLRLAVALCSLVAFVVTNTSSPKVSLAQESPVVSAEIAPAAEADATTESAPDYITALKPFLTTHCSTCHLNGESEAGVDLSQFEDGKSLLKDRMMWERVIEVITAGTMPPEDASQRPANEEVVAVCNALNQYYQYIDRTAKPDPGRVTMRRLNRVEYRNTVRRFYLV